jgi:hypothetical protein
MRLLRTLAVLAGHFLAAVIGTAIFQAELWYVFHAKTFAGRLNWGNALSAVVAFALGYFV